MNESALKSILEGLALCEWAEYANVGEHVFSTGHNRSMQRIFKLYGKNTRKLRLYTFQKSKTSTIFTRKKLLIAIVAVFLALLTGCAVAYFISQNFHGEVTSVSTNILPINTENCPETIEEIYNISDIPMGFEKISDNSDPFSRTVEYMNSSTKQMIVFSQYAKPGLGTLNLNTEKNKLEEIEINGYNGIFLEQIGETSICGIIIWDNGDYVFEIFANLSKEEIIDLANITKLS